MQCVGISLGVYSPYRDPEFCLFPYRLSVCLIVLHAINSAFDLTINHNALCVFIFALAGMHACCLVLCSQQKIASAFWHTPLRPPGILGFIIASKTKQKCSSDLLNPARVISLILFVLCQCYFCQRSRYIHIPACAVWVQRESNLEDR